MNLALSYSIKFYLYLIPYIFISLVIMERIFFYNSISTYEVVSNKLLYSFRIASNSLFLLYLRFKFMLLFDIYFYFYFPICLSVSLSSVSYYYSSFFYITFQNIRYFYSVYFIFNAYSSYFCFYVASTFFRYIIFLALIILSIYSFISAFFFFSCNRLAANYSKLLLKYNILSCRLSFYLSCIIQVLMNFIF